MTIESIGTDQMTLKELRRLVAEADGVPDEATFSLDRLANRLTLLASWKEPNGKFTGIEIRRSCPCGHEDCPDREG